MFSCIIYLAQHCSDIQHQILNTALSNGMGRARADNLILCAGEASTNALKHAGTLGMQEIPVVSPLAYGAQPLRGEMAQESNTHGA